MVFEWDEEKNEENIRTHGLDFGYAQEVFNAPMLIRSDTPKNYDEDRFVGIGFLRNFVVVIVYTERAKDTIRVISLRKALKHERQRFEEALRNQLGEA